MNENYLKKIHNYDPQYMEIKRNLINKQTMDKIYGEIKLLLKQQEIYTINTSSNWTMDITRPNLDILARKRVW